MGTRIRKKVANRKGSVYEELYRHSAVGIEFVACIVIGLAMGYGFDWIFDTDPYGLLAGLIFGVAAAFRVLYRLVKNLRNTEQDTHST